MGAVDATGRGLGRWSLVPSGSAVAAVILGLAGLAQMLAGGIAVADLLPQFALGTTINALVFSSTGVLMARRRPHHPVGWLFLGLGLLAGTDSAVAGHAALGGPSAGLAGWVSNWIWFPSYALLGVCLLILPDGHVRSRRWRPVAGMLALASATGTVALALRSTPNAPVRAFSNPLAVPWLDRPAAVVIDMALWAVVCGLLAGALSLVLRLRDARGEERRQLRLVCSGTALAVVLYVATGIAGIGWFGYTFAWPVLAVSVGIAILRHRLFDIDVVLSRTVLASLLALFITLSYVAIAVGVGSLLSARGDVRLSVVAATVVAVAFDPVRRRLRAVVDRLVLGARAEPLDVLAQASRRLSDSIGTEQALRDVGELIARGTGAERVVVWRVTPGTLVAVASWPTPQPPEALALLAPDRIPVAPGDDLTVEVRDSGELVGALSLRKRRGEALTAGDEALVRAIASQTALALRNDRLSSELVAHMEKLQRSRRRLVSVQDEERRRLERDLHDGAQQQLLGLKAKIGAAYQLAAQGETAAAAALLSEVADDADDAIGSLRQLARGIFPPLLAEKGLGPALAAQARKSAVPVTLDVDGLPRLDRSIETATYFCCLEAMGNVARHARASRCEVTVRAGEGRLSFRVQDDGQGMAAPDAHGTGLMGMRDRIETLGGSLAIESAPGAGTVVAGWLPQPASTPHHRDTAAPPAPAGAPSPPR